MQIKHWFQFFRLPNLPTAPGDALAGAAVCLALNGGDVRAALVAGVAALFLYMYGLADNDITGAAADVKTAPDRPIPRGEISLRAAKIGRSVCLFGALIVAALFNLPAGWWLAATLLTGMICLYNRTKNKWLMGGCRALSVVCGAAAVMPFKFSWSPAWGVVAALAVGWTFYIAAVTKLSEGEDAYSDEGLGRRRYLSGLSALIPLSGGLAFTNSRMWLLPAIGCAWAFASWCAAVYPLGKAHTSEERRIAVGRAVGALFYMQTGFVLTVPNQVFIAVVVALWISGRFIRRLAPSVRGS